jgi:hypothetical protein
VRGRSDSAALTEAVNTMTKNKLMQERKSEANNGMGSPEV